MLAQSEGTSAVGTLRTSTTSRDLDFHCCQALHRQVVSRTPTLEIHWKFVANFSIDDRNCDNIHRPTIRLTNSQYRQHVRTHYECGNVYTAVLTINHRLIPKADRKKIHEYLFREGVLVAKKDFNLPKHGEIDTKNLYVRLGTPTL